jgi:hypothetical protein
VIIHIERGRADRFRRIATISEVVAVTRDTGSSVDIPTLRTLAERREDNTMTVVADLQRTRR